MDECECTFHMKILGGKGSGNFEHGGRPGQVGGSSSSLLSTGSIQKIKEQYKKDAEFRKLADTLTAYTQGGFRVVRSASALHSGHIQSDRNKTVGPATKEKGYIETQGWGTGNVYPNGNIGIQFMGHSKFKPMFDKQNPKNFPTVKEAGKIVNEAISQSDKMPAMYRGLGIATEQITSLKKGQTTIIPGASSFSDKESVAVEFSSGRSHRLGRQRAILVVEGAPGLDVRKISKFKKQSEFITRGKFKVRDVKVEQKRDHTLHTITMSYVDDAMKRNEEEVVLDIDMDFEDYLEKLYDGEDMKTNMAKRKPATRYPLRYDPTRTTAIRNAFAREVRARFRAIKKMIMEALLKQDVLDMKTNAPLPRKAYQFSTNPAKAKGFLDWVDKMVEAGVLQKSISDPRGSSAWADLYISSSYKKSIVDSYTQLKSAEKTLRKQSKLDKAMRIAQTVGVGNKVEETMLKTAFIRPLHADAMGLLYTRTFTDLKGITADLGSRLSRILTKGLAEGQGANAITQDIVKDMGKEIGLTIDQAERRAETIARTEIIRAYHVAQVNAFEEAGIENVSVKAEWLAILDDRVCEYCKKMNGRVFSLDKIRGMIPAHPNCRCAIAPVVV